MHYKKFNLYFLLKKLMELVLSPSFCVEKREYLNWRFKLCINPVQVPTLPPPPRKKSRLAAHYIAAKAAELLTHNVFINLVSSDVVLSLAIAGLNETETLQYIVRNFPCFQFCCGALESSEQSFPKSSFAFTLHSVNAFKLWQTLPQTLFSRMRQS